jgi:DNA transposition AAA+ family ATPase
VYYGRREETEIVHLAEEILRYRRVVEEREGMADAGFIETSLSRAIWKCCERAFLRQRLTCIFGESQIGKTTAVIEYQRRHNHGETYYLRMPTRGVLGDLFEALAHMLGIPTGQKHRTLRRRIMESFDDRNLIIIDEAHQCLSTHYGGAGVSSLEFLREIHDERHCGMVICGTNVLRDGILRGSNSRILRQLWLRCHAPLYLPNIPTPEQMAEFSRAFKLEPAADKFTTTDWEDEWGHKHHTRENQIKLQEKVLLEHGLGRWISILQEAADDARQAGVRITWGRVIAAHARFAMMETVSEL